MSPTEEPMARLGGSEESELWRQARERCLACASEGLLDEGYLRVKDRPAAEVEWVGPAPTSPFHFGFEVDPQRLPLRARRCRECHLVVFFAEERD